MRTRRHRRWVKGTAMTEMLVGLPVMILLFAGVDYFRMGYAKRLETMSQSHAEAWHKAYSNDGSCYAAGKGPFQGWTDSNSQMPDNNGGGQSLDSKFDSTMFMYGVAHAPKTMQATSARWSATVGSNTSITCNEVVPKEDRNVLTPLVDFIKSFI